MQTSIKYLLCINSQMCANHVNKSEIANFSRLSFKAEGGNTPISVTIPPVIKSAGVISNAGFQQLIPTMKIDINLKNT